ncbi:MAG TPA: hypothetical protein VJ084_03640 [Nitrospinota bacterium]|nr:hypothetical protein [Nitrospinota bacterium]
MNEKRKLSFRPLRFCHSEPKAKNLDVSLRAGSGRNLRFLVSLGMTDTQCLLILFVYYNLSDFIDKYRTAETAVLPNG